MFLKLSFFADIDAMSHELLFSKVKLKINQFIDDLKSTDSLVGYFLTNKNTFVLKFSGMKFASMLMLIRYRTAELLSRSLSLISWKKRTKTPANSSRRKGLVDSLTMEVF